MTAQYGQLGAGSSSLSHFIVGGDAYFGPITSSNVGGTGNANNVGSDTTSSMKGFDLLAANVAHQAFYNSGESADPSTCHPDTRVAVLADLEKWVDQPEENDLIRWVKGSAGVGKTVIVRTMAETLNGKNQLLASFFFWRSGQRCNNAQYFIATISYQICQLLPPCKTLIARVIEEDPHIFTRSMKVQVDKLVISPIASVWQEGKHNAKGTLVIVVDGLDECLEVGVQSQDVERQCTIISEMHRAIIHSQQRGVPLLLLLASRPERHIQGAFDKISKQGTSIMLNESHDATNDIRRYYNDKFCEIRNSHPLRHHLPKSEWPSEYEVESLVERASGQFIYASTVVQFVGSKKKIPSTQLKAVLVRQDHGSPVSSLGKLDLLYQTIFAQIDQDDLPATQRLLGILLSGDEYKFRTRKQSPTFWDLFLRWQPGEVERLLMSLDSVLSIRLVEGKSHSHEFFHFYHASLQEFLLDQSRSGPFFIDLKAAHQDMAVLCIQHLPTGDGLISQYLQLTTQDLLEDIDLTPTLEEAFVKGGVNGVYPPNLKLAYPSFLDAIRGGKRKYDPTYFGVKHLYEEKHGLYLSLLQDIVEQYLTLKEDLSVYLVIVAAEPGHYNNEKGYFLGEIVAGRISDEVKQFDQKNLALYDYHPPFWYQGGVFAGALFSILDKMPDKGALFARAASIFVKSVHRFDWSRHRTLGGSYPVAEVGASILGHLLKNAAPLRLLQSCMEEYPILDTYGDNPNLRDSVARMKDAVAEYISRVEAEETPLRSGGLKTSSPAQRLVQEISSEALIPSRIEAEDIDPQVADLGPSSRRRQVAEKASSLAQSAARVEVDDSYLRSGHSEARSTEQQPEQEASFSIRSIAQSKEQWPKQPIASFAEPIFTVTTHLQSTRSKVRSKGKRMRQWVLSFWARLIGRRKPKKRLSGFRA